jgi:hypothetical protein
MEDKIGDLIGMPSKSRLEVAHLAKQCARQFALWNTFKAFQLWMEDKTKLISEIQFVKDQEEKRRVVDGKNYQKIEHISPAPKTIFHNKKQLTVKPKRQHKLHQ